MNIYRLLFFSAVFLPYIQIGKPVKVLKRLLSIASIARIGDDMGRPYRDVKQHLRS